LVPALASGIVVGVLIGAAEGALVAYANARFAIGLAGIAVGHAWLGLRLIHSLVAGILVGGLIGWAQATKIGEASIPAFIVTLGGLLVWRGVIKGISSGQTIPLELSAFKSLGQCYVAPVAGYIIAAVSCAAIIWLALRRNRARRRHGFRPDSTLALGARIIIPSAIVVGFIAYMNKWVGVPIPVVILLAVALGGAFVTQNTTFGRYLYAIGGNPDAARLSGISIRRHLLAVFCIMGALAGVAALIYTSRVGSASPDAGVLLELDAIAACVIGGASLMGGRGTVFGACLGALFMASLDNGMSLKNVPDFTQDIVRGAILVTAVGLDMLGRKRS
jgi:D-xylose transport system permease protein